MTNPATVTLAFDVYGTLIDAHGVVLTLEKYIGQQAPDFSNVWRNKQLEYAFRRGLMGQYMDFSVCTRDAFEFACEYYKLKLTAREKEKILATYKQLPAFEDIQAGLQDVQDAGHKLFAFSNGTSQAVDALLKHAGLRDYFIDVVSVDEVKSFKPDPAVYRHFLARAGTSPEHAWLVSSNPFDVLGAMAIGMKGAWVRRTAQAIYDPWGIEPTVTVSNLSALSDVITELQ